jgi:hypothetical protein
MSSIVHSIAIESFDVSSMLQRRELEMCMEYARVILKDVCKKQGLDFAKVESEVVYPRLSKSSKVPKKKVAKEGKIRDVPSVVLPFLGVVDNWCKGVKRNHGLYTQCSTVARDGNLCGKCSRNTPFGLITSRVVGETEFEHNDKRFKVARYGDVMSKLDISRDVAECEAERFSWKLSEDDFKVSEKKRRGPKKKDVSEVSGGSDNEKEEKKRGRPKKDKKMVSTNGDDLIARLVAEAGVEEKGDVDEEEEGEVAEEEEEVPIVVNAVSVPVKKTKKSKDEKEEEKKKKEEEKKKKEEEKKRKEEEKEAVKKQKEAEAAAKKGGKVGGKKKETVVEEESEEEEVAAPVVMKVRKFEFEGKKYKLSSDNILYDWESDEPVGIWNVAKNCIDEYEDSSCEGSDEEDDE